MRKLEDIVIKSPNLNSILLNYIRNQSNTVIILLSTEFNLIDYNDRFSEIFQQELKQGRLNLRTITINEHHPRLENFTNDFRTRLGFRPFNSEVFSLDCHIYKSDGYYVLIGSHHMLTTDSIIKQMAELNKEMAHLTRELQKKNRALEEAARTIKTLSGLIPICAWCKKIRDDDGYWSVLEEYFRTRTEAEFSHSICPDCMEKME